jgi:hypothetical protein
MMYVQQLKEYDNLLFNQTLIDIWTQTLQQKASRLET